MKPKELTFIWQDMDNNTHHLLHWRTTRRTVAEAWEDAEKTLSERHGELPEFVTGRFQLLQVFRGLVEPMDENVPLRKPNVKDLREVTK